MLRTQISWKRARSPRSRNGEPASVCSTASDVFTSPSTASDRARTVSCMPRSMISRRSARSWRTMTAAKSSSGSTAAASPVGEDASSMPAIAIAEGFNLGYCKAKPGKGPLMHNHDTNETFIPMTGRWRCEWNEGDALQYVDLDPYDVVSFPPGVARRFMNVTYDEPEKEHLLLFVIGGNQPQAEFTSAAMRRCDEYAAKQRATSPARGQRKQRRAAA